MQAPARRHPQLALLARQFVSPIMVILVVATIVSMVVGDLISGAIILGIIIPSGLLGYFQERRAGQIMETLLKRIQITVEVIREGREISIPESEVVVGDLVVLRVGDVIPGDCVVVESDGLLVDESILTGESFPREKSVGQPTGGNITERKHELFLGTHVVGGKGQARVIAIGDATEFGAIVRAVGTKDVQTSFERGTLAFGFLLMRVMLLLVIGLFVLNVLVHKPLIESLLFSLALAVGLTPQLLPVIISVSLSLLARGNWHERRSWSNVWMRSRILAS
jgi:P-type Mg2+ transporter